VEVVLDELSSARVSSFSIVFVSGQSADFVNLNWITFS